ncbi:fumarylacetoacetate hydrolase family protein [Colwellia sp. MB3u-70]|uniref:2-keto-4-pentenoate hydratase n=1 Tax=unclassified Colwellia TaxID=196834 RepID=UPI0015F60E6D|nr:MULTISPECIES: fumarylacetoacetate hydrolase family protein [unclassified Colwellia]MBA6291016.1 fumarylacetoacetate hydrolase family protein [Colwellia sp. MB3u-8]MBA6308265.1 fumarylacetoacetate hydrolase family protein [Colwellia sp. MB3u-70]
MLNDIAHTLDQAAASAASVEQISLTKKITLPEAYEIQKLSIERRLDRGEKLVGYKMGFTSRAKMLQMGVDDLIWGRLTDAMQIEEDQEIDLTKYVHPRAEPEIAFLLNKPLSGKVTKAEALAAVEAIAPAIEIIDSRYQNFKFSLEDVVADNSSSSGFVIGQWQSKDSNLNGLAMHLTVNNKLVASGSSNDILDHPINSLVEAARCIGAAGEELKAGQIILAGAATAAVALEPNQTISANVINLGRCQFKTKG